ncbi:MAG: FAD-binding oxidoreductase [Solirubrobacteraceae bacterium]
MANLRGPAPQLRGSWWGWGDPDQVPQLSAEIHQLLRGALGVRGPLPRLESIADLAPAPSRLAPELIASLEQRVGAERISLDAESRIRHTRGKSTPDLLRIRAGDLDDAPDLVATPADHDQVLALLAICSAHRIAVVPFGGGSSVVGGLVAARAGYAGVIALDTSGLSGLLALDDESRVATLGPGLRGPAAEALLGARGYTIGHFPQSFQYATLGGFAAARSSGQASAGYGRFDDLVLSLRVATPSGTLSLGRAPKSAAGPDLRQLMLGSEGAFGVITELAVQIRPAPEARVYEGWRFPDFARGAAALRRLIQDGPRPTVLRLSDEAETALDLARPAELGQSVSGGCLAIVGYEGSEPDVRDRRTGGERVMRALGGQPEPEAGESWSRGRFLAPYLRDALLDAGALVETLETVCFWSALASLYAAVGHALRDSLGAQGTPPVILCHISHVYPSGASLYFTVGCAAADDPVGQWGAAKAAASDAILAAGGSITHHHGVGSDHRPWFEQEIGELAVDALRAVKARLDPAWILNPGVLLAPQRPEPSQI